MKCIVCDFGGDSESELTHHYESKHISGINSPSPTADSFKCRKCKDTFTEKKSLEAHIKRYHVVQEKGIKCKVCEYKTDSPIEMTKH